MTPVSGHENVNDEEMSVSTYYTTGFVLLIKQAIDSSLVSACQEYERASDMPLSCLIHESSCLLRTAFLHMMDEIVTS